MICFGTGVPACTRVRTWCEHMALEEEEEGEDRRMGSFGNLKRYDYILENRVHSYSAVQPCP